MAWGNSARRQTVHRTEGLTPERRRHAHAPDGEDVAEGPHQVGIVGAQMDAGHRSTTQRERPLAGEEAAEER
jgi:hypothetical protein